jgi:hypothetical protein
MSYSVGEPKNSRLRAMKDLVHKNLIWSRMQSTLTSGSLHPSTVTANNIPEAARLPSRDLIVNRALPICSDHGWSSPPERMYPTAWPMAVLIAILPA